MRRKRKTLVNGRMIEIYSSVVWFLAFCLSNGLSLSIVRPTTPMQCQSFYIWSLSSDGIRCTSFFCPLSRMALLSRKSRRSYNNTDQIDLLGCWSHVCSGNNSRKKNYDDRKLSSLTNVFQGKVAKSWQGYLPS